MNRHEREMAESYAINPDALEVGAERNLVYTGPRGENGMPLCEHPRCRTEAVGPFDHRCYRHFGVVTIEDLDETLDAWLNVRVQAHRARGGPDTKTRAIDASPYKRLLAVVRRVEDVLEPWRRELGATCSLAYQRATTDEQLSFEDTA